MDHDGDDAEAKVALHAAFGASDELKCNKVDKIEKSPLLAAEEGRCFPYLYVFFGQVVIN